MQENGKNRCAPLRQWTFFCKCGRYREYRSALMPVRRSGCEIEGLKFYGSPWTPVFYDWAFMLPEVELAGKWAMIPACPGRSRQRSQCPEPQPGPGAPLSHRAPRLRLGPPDRLACG